MGRGTFTALALALSAVACGSNTAVSSADAGAEAAPPAHHAEPPPNPGGPAPDGASDVVLVMRSIDLGTSPKDAWEHLGYDLDGQISTVDGPATCQAVVKAYEKNILPDGDDGIDNGFGANMGPLLTALVNEDPGQRMSSQLEAGDVSLLFRLESIGAGADYSPVRAHVAVAVKTAGAPAWDGSDVRDVLADPPAVDFDDGYITGDTWVSGPPSAGGVLALPLVLVPPATYDPEPYVLLIHRPVITLHLSADRRSADSGIIAGFLQTDEFNKGLCDYTCRCGGAFSCCDFTFQTSLYPDSLVDGAIDRTKKCDAISIGVGFTAGAAQLGQTVAAPQPLPCPTP